MFSKKTIFKSERIHFHHKKVSKNHVKKMRRTSCSKSLATAIKK
jgi:hypothetical protein